jgi:hypothetical protein
VWARVQRTHAARGLDPVADRHVHVHQHQGRAQPLDFVRGRFTVGGFAHDLRIGGAVQVGAHRGTELRRVVDHEHAQPRSARRVQQCHDHQSWRSAPSAPSGQTRGLGWKNP